MTQFNTPAAANGTDVFNSIVVNSIMASSVAGSTLNITAVIGSTVTGSSLTLPGGTAGNGLYQVVTGTTAAANGTTFVAHGLGVVPSGVQLTCVGTAGAPYLVSATNGTIGFGSNVGTVAVSALVIR